VSFIGKRVEQRRLVKDLEKLGCCCCSIGKSWYLRVKKANGRRSKKNR
jgi:hypothetical protein